mmetsp:Transcript_21608/g.30267  ORF Transcript_21608/g.30267 Transcript_21608/m.30267 type:complete len:81 (-) Transcript_21608:538-780(-)
MRVITNNDYLHLLKIANRRGTEWPPAKCNLAMYSPKRLILASQDWLSGKSGMVTITSCIALSLSSISACETGSGLSCTVS